VKKNQLDFFVIGDTGGKEINFGKGRMSLSYVTSTSIQVQVAGLFFVLLRYLVW
jgi:hypothetical protein